MVDEPETSRKPWRTLLHLSAAVRWLLALAILLAAVAVWLEILAPDRPLPVFLVGVAASGLLCGAGPGIGVTLGAAVAIWWFASDVPDMTGRLPGGWTRLLLFFAASAALLAVAAVARRLAAADRRGGA